MSIKNNDELFAQAVNEYEKSIVKILLLCVDNLEFGLGINKLVQILINILTQMEYLDKQVYKNGFGDIYKVGIKGYALLEKDLPLEVSFIDAITECDFIEFDSTEIILYEKLRALRYQIAKENDYPAYAVCGDLALRKMTKALPENQEEMLEIKGIGPSFVEKYANRFISVIKQFKFDE